MLSRKADGPLTVQIPAPAQDRPSWTRVGIITAIGFVVGVAWPRLAGVRLGPSVPESTSGNAVASAAPPEPAANGAPAATGATPAAAAPVPSAPAAAALAPGAPSAAPPAPAPVSLTVGHGFVFACRTSDGDTMKGSDCGSLPGLDGVVMPRLRKIADCPEAAQASGKVHLIVHLDLTRGGLNVELGKGRNQGAPEGLLACARTAMAGAPLGGVSHENPRYSVAYTLTFAGGAAASSASASATPAQSASGGGGAGGDASGAAQVVWEVAIVRDAPKTGKVIARLQRGTELHLGAPKDGWYPVKFGDGFASDGWVYRGAIGR